MEYVDTRDWPEYNAKLVRRGEFYLDLSCVKNWGRELREMNRRKRGAPYKYPKTFITFASIIYTFFRMPYRQLEGFIDRLSAYEPGLVAADYTTLHKRISKQSLDLQIPENDAVVAVDSTGIKVTNRGDWMREKHGKKRRGWLKVHVAVDVESKRLLSLEVTEEDTSDSEVLRPLLEDVNIEDALADGAYDTNDAFEFMKSKSVDYPGIKIRENAVVGKEESARSDAVLEYKKMGYNGWKQMHQYGRRWAVEGFFSSIKRIFGETVRASSPEGMVSEVKRAFILYNILISI
ncbi:MAG TPA: IS5 family transposase [Methanothrix sp.]|nr:IS5 family transposase [Methanothrix sp.]